MRGKSNCKVCHKFTEQYWEAHLKSGTAVTDEKILKIFVNSFLLKALNPVILFLTKVLLFFKRVSEDRCLNANYPSSREIKFIPCFIWN
jgi:hypothetical protein